MRSEIAAGLTLVLILLLGWGGYALLFGEGGGARLSVESVEGEVRRQVDGRSELAQPGQALEERDRIVAGLDGTAVLALDDGSSRVVVRPKSEVTVKSVGADGLRVGLEGGRVEARVLEGGRPVTVEAGERAVRTADGDVAVARGADGTVVVRATRGGADLFGFGTAVRASAGQDVVAPAGGRAVQVADHAGDLLLDVSWPGEAQTRAVMAEVRGTTQPGAQLTVSCGAGAVHAAADPDGRFTVQVALAEGVNTCTVHALGLLGEEVDQQHVIERDTTGPSIKATFP